jgi:hypothetical protein
MSGYTKLFGSILESTVWMESPPVKVVWITLLAMADRDGVVEASVPGLAKRAGVDRAHCEQALSVFSAPDPDSRTTAFEGRRIEAVEGGWRLLNHAVYRERASREEAREKAAARQRLKRERDAAKSRLSREVTNVTPGNDIAEAPPPPPPPPTSEAQADLPSVVPIDRNATLDPAPSALDVGFSDFWTTYPKKVGKGAAMKVWRRIKPNAPLRARIQLAITDQTHTDQWRKDAGQFIPNPATWLNQGRWDDEPIAPTEPAHEPGTYVNGFRLEDLELTPDERAAKTEMDKIRARYIIR